MKPSSALGIVLTIVIGLLVSGCVSDQQNAAANYPVESTSSYAHGEASVMYGRTVGH
jgi:hypothetical protein